MSSRSGLSDDAGRVGYDPTTETYYNQHNWDSGHPIYISIAETVAAVSGSEPTAMEPLYSILDPDALDALLSSPRNSEVRFTFSYEGCTVTVRSSGEIAVRRGE
jgi:hypothetical protein